MLHLPSCYTSQHTCVCAVHLALTLSNSGLPIRVFSSIKPVIPTITFKDMMWTQAPMSDKQVVKVCESVQNHKFPRDGILSRDFLDSI